MIIPKKKEGGFTSVGWLEEEIKDLAYKDYETKRHKFIVFKQFPYNKWKTGQLDISISK